MLVDPRSLILQGMKTLFSLGACALTSAIVTMCTLDMPSWAALGLAMGLGMIALALIELLFTFTD